jgi:hypothetical protein
MRVWQSEETLMKKIFGLPVVAVGGLVLVTVGTKVMEHRSTPSVAHVTRIGAMSVDRAAHQATLLHDGRVLVTGGCAGNHCEQILASAELYDPSSRTFRRVASMGTARASHAAALLPDGRVLVAGGWTSNGPTASAEVYDPATGRWTALPDMTEPRVSLIAVPLQDGRVLMMGGGEGRLPDQGTSEVFDPATDSFTLVVSMHTNHYLATRMADGRVLLTGGQGPDGSILRSAEIFDPGKGTFEPTGDMLVPRVKHAAALLDDGQVLIIGGSDRRGFRDRFASTEIYDPTVGRFSAGPAMHWVRHKIRDAVATLPSGAVVIAGGAVHPEIFEPGSEAFVPVEGTLSGPQMFATASLLGNGDVLVLGGYDDRTQPSASAWLIVPER